MDTTMNRTVNPAAQQPTWRQRWAPSSLGMYLWAIPALLLLALVTPEHTRGAEHAVRLLTIVVAIGAGAILHELTEIRRTLEQQRGASGRE